MVLQTIKSVLVIMTLQQAFANNKLADHFSQYDPEVFMIPLTFKN